MVPITACCLLLAVLVLVSDAHPAPQSSSTATNCDKMPASTVYQGTCYFQNVKGRGFTRQHCPSGTRYNATACACQAAGAPRLGILSSILSAGRHHDEGDDLHDSSVSVLSLLKHKARILRGLLSKAPAAILKHILRGARGRGGDDDNERGFETENDDKEVDDDDEREDARSFGGSSGGSKKNLFELFAKTANHPRNHNYLSAYQYKPQIPRNLFDIFNFGIAGRSSISWRSSAKRGDGDDEDGLGGNENDDHEDDFGKGAGTSSIGDEGGKDLGSGGHYGTGLGSGKGVIGFPGLVGSFREADKTDDDSGFGRAGNDDGRDDEDGRLGRQPYGPGQENVLRKVHPDVVGSGAHDRYYGFSEDDREVLERDDADDDSDDDDEDAGTGGFRHHKHGYLSPYSVKGMLTRNKNYHFDDLLVTIFNHDDADDDLYGDDSDDDDALGGFDNDIFDDYEHIYENKFDGVLEYVDRISNGIFNDDFDDFYEDLFDDDGYDDCFVKKYQHYFSDDYESEIDDKYDDFDDFFSRHFDKDDGGDNRGDAIGGPGINNSGKTDTYPKAAVGDRDDSLKDDSPKDDSIKDDSPKDEVDGDDGGIWSGTEKFTIYDNLFGSLRKSGTQDSRLFNFGETLKGKSSSQPSSTSDDGGNIFDEFYKESGNGFLRDYR